MAELAAGCRALGIDHASLFLGDVGSGAELEARLLGAMNTSRPDFLLTVNHSGLDREGVVSGICRQLQAPLLSWFVDRPELFLPAYSNLENPWLAYAVWDADAVAGLKDQADGRVFHLPLGVDLSRITFLPQSRPVRDVAFVGNSMQTAVERCWKASGVVDADRPCWDAAAAGYAVSELRDVVDYLRRDHPAVWEQRRGMRAEEVDALDAFLYWRSTQMYRIRCVSELLPFEPVVAGDEHWRFVLGSGSWSYAEPLNYYAELPNFYRWTRINFNTTSTQMKGALNQRVFDVPASGGFLITDSRDQLNVAFDVGQEVVCYDDPGEIGMLVRHYLTHPTSAVRIANRARMRIEREHSYAHRLATMCGFMRSVYGTPA